MHLALVLYQGEYGGEGIYGKPSAMGFPSQEYITLNRLGTPLSLWQSPCGQNFKWEPKPFVIQYEFFPYQVVEDKEVQYADQYRQNLLTFRDLNCSDDFEDLYNPLLSHRGLGVLLSGELVDIKKQGDIYFDPGWWATALSH